MLLFLVENYIIIKFGALGVYLIARVLDCFFQILSVNQTLKINMLTHMCMLGRVHACAPPHDFIFVAASLKICIPFIYINTLTQHHKVHPPDLVISSVTNSFISALVCPHGTQWHPNQYPSTSSRNLAEYTWLLLFLSLLVRPSCSSDTWQAASFVYLP